jgi:hypothetical protein
MKPTPEEELNRLRGRFGSLADYEEEALPSLWAAVVLRLRDAGLIRGHGSVPGELAETLMARWYDGELSPPSTADVDVMTQTGRRIQVKALRFSNPGRSSVASFTREVAFDELAIVCFEYDMTVREALLVDAALLRVGDGEKPGLLTPAGRRLTLGKRLRQHATVITAAELWHRAGGVQRDLELHTGSPREQLQALLERRSRIETVKPTAEWHLQQARTNFPPRTREEILSQLRALAGAGLLPAEEVVKVEAGIDAALQEAHEAMVRAGLADPGGP